MTIRVIHGDCRTILPTLDAGSVQCCVTSPPYFGLRDYGTAQWDGGDAGCDHVVGINADRTQRDAKNAIRDDATGAYAHPSGWRGGGRAMDLRQCKCGAVRVDAQIGLEPTVGAYIAELVAVFREVRRVLRDDGCVFLNLGDSYAGSQRAGAYGTGGKAPEGSTGDGCLCGSLCDACRVAYRIGRFRSGNPRVPMPVPSNASSIPEHMAAPLGHLPRSGLVHPVGRNAAATRDPAPSVSRVGALLPVDQGSKPDEYDPQPRAECSQTSKNGECLLCGCSLPAAAHVSADSSASLCEPHLSLLDTLDQSGSRRDTSATDGASDYRTSGMVCGCCSYPGYTTAYHHVATSKPKDLLMMPARVALALQADGWWLRSDIIWAKPNPMPESVTDRPTSAHEHVFLLTKQPRYFWDAEAVREEAEYGYSPTPQMFNGVGDLTRAPTRKHGGVQQGSGGTRNMRNVWTIATHPYIHAHFATFPPELAERCIKAGTSERGCCAACGAPWGRVTAKGEPVQQHWAPGTQQKIDIAQGRHGATSVMNTGFVAPNVTTGWSSSCRCDAETQPCTVLDPFGGAGTTGLVADRLGRHATLIELSPSYTSMASARITDDCPLFAEVAD